MNTRVFFYLFLLLCLSASFHECTSVEELKAQKCFCAPMRLTSYIETLFEENVLNITDFKTYNLDSLLSGVFGSEYFKIQEAQAAIHSDAVKDHECLSGPKYENATFHVPGEEKCYNTYNSLKRDSYNFIENPYVSLNDLASNRWDYKSNEVFFPRILHLRKKLPKLTPEPYQRVMSFAIEVCMIPKMWYLELIHCMYMGMAPFFKGMLMSYSLQDLVGAAVKTVGYMDLSFSMENCRKAVSLVSDDSISPNYEYICQQMKVCLESKAFEKGEYSRFRDEFQERIKRVYTFGSKFDANLNQLASFYLRTGISSSPYSGGFNKNHNERNFVPVRAMVSMISLNNFIFRSKVPIHTRTTKYDTLAMLLSLTLQFPTRRYFSCCKKYLKTNLKPVIGKQGLTFEMLCKEFVSVGFIDESFEVIGDDREKFIQATKPTRILHKNYAQVVSEIGPDCSAKDNKNEWLEFLSDDSDIKDVPTSRPPLTKFYKSKLLSKTKKRGRKDSSHVGIETKPVETRGFKKVTRGTRLILSRLVTTTRAGRGVKLDLMGERDESDSNTSRN